MFVSHLQRNTIKKEKMHFLMILKSYVDALISSPKLQSCAHFKQPSWSVKPVSRRQQTENVNQPRPSVTKANTINCEQMSYFAPCGLIKLPVIYLPYYLIQRFTQHPNSHPSHSETISMSQWLHWSFPAQSQSAQGLFLKEGL